MPTVTGALLQGSAVDSAALLLPLPAIVLAHVARRRPDTTWAALAEAALWGGLALVALLGGIDLVAGLSGTGGAPRSLAPYGAGILAVAAVVAAALSPPRAALIRPGTGLRMHDPVHRLAVLLLAVLAGFQVVSQLTTDVLAEAAAGTSLSRVDLVSQELPFALAALAGVGLFVGRGPGAALTRLGVVVPRWWHLPLALAAALAFFAFGSAMDELGRWLTPHVADRVDAATGRIFRDLSDPGGIITVALAAGVCEELLFRGALQPRFGIAVTAVAFAAVHTQYGLSLDAAAVLVLAVALGVLRRLLNTTATITCHVTYNALVGFGLGGAAAAWAWPAGAALAVLAAAGWALDRRHRHPDPVVP